MDEHFWSSHTPISYYRLIVLFREGLSLTLWAKHSSLLAVGTVKGNLILYNQRTRRYFVCVLFNNDELISI